MPAPVRYCSSCGHPANCGSEPVSLMWECPQCRAFTLSFAAGWLDKSGEESINLPLPPRLGNHEIYWECEICHSGLNLEISLVVPGRPCNGCEEAGLVLQGRRTVELERAPEQRTTLLTKEEMDFLSQAGGVA